MVTALTRLSLLSLAECEERVRCVYGQLAGLPCLERLAVKCREGEDVRAVGQLHRALKMLCIPTVHLMMLLMLASCCCYF